MLVRVVLLTGEELTLCMYLDYDATGKLGSGVVDGNLVSLGDFGQCKLVSRSLYCLADITATLQLPGSINAVCILLCPGDMMKTLLSKPLAFVSLVNYFC